MLVILLSGLLLVLALPSPGVAQQARTQRAQSDLVWKQVYERLPDFPRENQHVNRESRQVAEDNTLVGRLIRYHLYVKGRSPLLRFDWKLTLADYLGINEPIEETTYPSRATLRSNPYEADIAAIRRLDRAQRRALVQALVDSFTATAPQPATPSPTPDSTNTQPPVPTPAPMPRQPPPPPTGAGTADLLRPR